MGDPERTGGSGRSMQLPSESKIIARRAKIEERGVERIISGQERSVIIVEDTPKNDELESLRKLSGSRRSGDVRYDDVGNIILPTYQPVKTRLIEDSEGRVKKETLLPSGVKTTTVYRREIVNPHGRRFRVLKPEGQDQDYLTNLPEKKPVRELILSTVEGGIEIAIRQQTNVLGQYELGQPEGGEIEFARKVISFSEGLAFRFLLKRSVTRDDFPFLAKEIGNFLEDIGLYDPRDRRKSEVLDHLIKAAQLDRRGNPNWLRLMEQLLAARTRAVLRLTDISMTVGKFDRNFRELVSKREMYRWGFDLAARQLEYVLSAHPAFSQKKKFISYREREGLNDALIFIVKSHLAKPKVNPYLRSARWAAMNIEGCEDEKKDANRLILGNEVADKLFRRTPVTDLVLRGQFGEASRRIDLSIRQLRKTLADYESIENA
ncbi:hypothetical protein HY503_00340 [Candidatus Woesebacteria bacterium]|nr:hypothetical protein [Candidatus Woesebacteria bacterium]